MATSSFQTSLYRHAREIGQMAALRSVLIAESHPSAVVLDDGALLAYARKVLDQTSDNPGGACRMEQGAKAVRDDSG